MNGQRVISSKIKNPTVGSGYIVIPGDVPDREIYIAQAYSQERVAIYIEDLGFLASVRITRSAIREVIFPNIGDLGTGVIWLSTDGGEIFVIDTMSRGNESLLLNDGEFRFEKISADNSASISINEKGFTLEQATDYIKKLTGRFVFRAKSLVDIRSDGEVLIDAKKSIQLGLDNVEPALLGGKTLGKLNAIIDLEESLNNNNSDLLTELQEFSVTGAGAAIGVLAPLQPAFQSLNSSIIVLQKNIVENQKSITSVRKDIDQIKSGLLSIE